MGFLTHCFPCFSEAISTERRGSEGLIKHRAMGFPPLQSICGFDFTCRSLPLWSTGLEAVDVTVIEVKQVTEVEAYLMLIFKERLSGLSEWTLF